jgi:hypothetical protein
MTTMLRPVRMTGAESFWYVLGCISFGAAYLAKVPAKKALSEAGLVQLTSAERFWYVLQCIAFGAGYLAKVPVKKALSDLAAGPGGGRAPAQAAPAYEPGGWPGDLPFQPAQAVSSGPRYGRVGSGG